MPKNSERQERIDRVAQDLLDFGGRTYTITKLMKFLNADRDVAANLARKAPVMCGTNTGKRYYYRDLAEVICSDKH